MTTGSFTSRRNFLFSSYLAMKAAAAAPESKGEWRNKQTGMSYRRLGRTGFHISEVVMGGNDISPANYDHVLWSIDQGLNYLDTAPAYGGGQSEMGYAKVFGTIPRDRVFLNTKVSTWDLNRNRLYKEIFASLDETEQKRLKSLALDEIARRQADAPEYFIGYFGGQRGELDDAALANVMAQKYGERIDRGKNYKQLIIDSLDQSLKRLGTDHVDLLMCPHGGNTPYEILNHPEIFEAFETLKKAGKARFLGLSSHTDPGGVLEAAVKSKMYAAAMVAYNVVNKARVEPAIAAARKADLGVIAMKVARPVHMGRNRPTPPERVKMIDDAVPGDLKAPMKAYVWALKNPSLTAAISEMSTMQIAQENVPLARAKPGTRA